MAEPTNKYAPIWEHLKQAEECRVVVTDVSFNTIKKAVINLKNSDQAYRNKLAKEDKVARLTIEVIPDGIRFKLKITDIKYN